jgi:quercetin dioxygenase-like cupin family protein
MVTTLAGEGAVFAAAEGRAGLFAMRAGADYAAHGHAPRELYAILSGRARYWDERAGWREYGPGGAFVTPAWRWHAMRTDEQPVLILWAWTGEGMMQRPRFRDGSGCLPPA